MTFLNWKNKVVNAKKTCLNHIVWANKNITDIGSQLWNENLINRGILNISDFLAVNNTIMNYDQFCQKWDLDVADISSRDYVDIKMAIRSYNSINIANRDISQLDTEACMSFFINKDGSVKKILCGKIFRDKMYLPTSPDALPSLKVWSRELLRYNIDWSRILNNTFIGITNNYKLIQFQYKLLLRISTCKYMRYKMKIVRDNGKCSLCKSSLETLEHIFLYCSYTKIFTKTLYNFIRQKICREFRDIQSYYLITCDHYNPIVNYLNITAKWYISRKFQNSQPLIWEEYIRYIKFALTGERRNIKAAVEDILA